MLARICAEYDSVRPVLVDRDGQCADAATRKDRHVDVLPGPEEVPGVLRHLVRLSAPIARADGPALFLHCYARPLQDGSPPRLRFIRAADSGPEGIACVDDAARGALLALEVFQAERSAAALTLARVWLAFVAYMQEPDGRFINFILDRSGRKNRRGLTSYPGGPWWTARAARALAAAWRVTGDERYLDLFERSRIGRTTDLKVTAVQALALQELYLRRPTGTLRRRIVALCDRIVVGAQGGYLRDRKGQDGIMPWGYHQLQAVARAGRLFSRPDYLAACERTVDRVVAPLVAHEFAETSPWQHAPRCAYDVSSIMLGLEELYRATRGRRYRRLALACSAWVYGRNPAGAVLYDPQAGCCLDGLADGKASTHCGAESSIEAGFMELARGRLWGRRALEADASGASAAGISAL